MPVSGDDPTVPAQSDEDRTDAADVAQPAGAAPGGTMGRFVIDGVLGSGGMGVVLSAFDPELDRKVAIKVLHSHRPDAPPRQLLQREAQAMAKLSHPNAVQVYEVGRAGEHLFIAMELVEGTSLRAWLDAAPRGWREVLAMFVAAGHGLVAAHAAGLVHRDFKPENVLVGTDGRPRVSDFGLAEAGGSDPTVTGGTPIYMAPEQWEHGEVDARTDQFAFCVALWTALVGERPFEGATPAELKAAVTAGRRRVRGPAAGRAVPGWLTATLDRGMATAPAARWPDLAALLAEIARRQGTRRRVGIAAGGLALAAVSGGVAVAAMAVAGGDRARQVVAPPAPPIPVGLASKQAARVTFNDACEEFPAFSPDGKTVYFDGQVGKDFHLFAADTTTWAPRELTHAAGWDFAAAVAPDGRRLAYVHNGETGMSTQVAAILPDGSLGPARVIAQGPVRPAWSPDGTRVWAGERTAVVSYDVASGQERRRVVPPNDALPLLGRELADGSFVMLAASAALTASADTLYRYGPDGGAPVTLYHSAQMLDEVLALAPEGDAVFVAAYRTTGDSTELVRVPLDGSPPTPMGDRGVPARKQLAISTATGRGVWSDCHDVTNLASVTTDGDGSRLVDLPRGAWYDTFPRGVPGTTRLVFLSDRADGTRVWEIDRATPGPARRIPFGDIQPVQIAVSQDGTMVVASEGESGLWVGPVDGSAPPRRLAPDPGELAATFSHDGATIYFERTDGDQIRLAAVPVAGGAVTWVESVRSGVPAASPVDDRLAYFVQVGDAPGVRIRDTRTGKARDLTIPGPPMLWDMMEWSPDGTRLLVVRSDAGFVEFELATGKVRRTLATGAEMLAGVTYVGDELVVGRSRWLGDLWVTDLVRSAPPTAAP